MNIDTLRYRGAHSLLAIARSVIPLLSLRGYYQMMGDEAIPKRACSLDWKPLATPGVASLCAQLRLPRGACPEQNEILRSAQNDKKRRGSQ